MFPAAAIAEATGAGHSDPAEADPVAGVDVARLAASDVWKVAP